MAGGAGPLGTPALQKAQVDNVYEHAKELYSQERFAEALPLFEQVADTMLDYRNTTHYLEMCRQKATGSAAAGIDQPWESLPATIEENVGRLNVVCRVRPLNVQEGSDHAAPAATAFEDRGEIALSRAHTTSIFRFDHVLSPHSTQADAFNSTVPPLLQETMLGHDAAVLAYGLPGAGKTYTVEGAMDNEAVRGLVPRAMAALLQALDAPRYTRSQVYLMCLEICDEEFADLLADSPTASAQLKPQLRGSGGCVVCDFATKASVFSVDDVVGLVMQVQERRHLGNVQCPGRSSRAHCVYTLEVDTIECIEGGELRTGGRLHLVDLASGDRTGVGHPHSSWGLMNLERVVEALRQSGPGHASIPFTDSKLTWLLQEALLGKCRTSLIANVSPALASVEATAETLVFAEKMRSLTTSSSVAVALPRTSLPRTSLPLLQETAAVRSAARLSAAPVDVLKLVDGPGVGSSDVIDLQAKVKHLTNELQRAEERADGISRHSEAMAKQLSDAEAKRVKAEIQAEERDFVKSNTVEFADRRSGEARALAEALESSRARNSVLSERLAESRGTLAAVRAQMRSLCGVADGMLPQLTSDSVGPHALEASDADSNAIAAHGRVWEALTSVVQEQSRVIGSLGEAMREAASDLDDLVSGTSNAACESIEEQRKDAQQCLLSIEASVRSVNSAIADCQKKLGSATEEFGGQLDSLTIAVEQELRSGAETYASSARGLASELAASRAAAFDAQSDAAKTFEAARAPFFDFCKQLGAAAAEADRDREVAASLAHRLSEEAGAGVRRRTSMREIITGLLESHGAAATGDVPKRLDRALELLGDVLTTAGSSVDSRLGANSVRLESIHADIEDGARSGEAGLRQALDEADEALNAAWKEGRAGLARLAAPVDGTAAVIAARLLSAVASLDEVRESVARDVATLRQQRCTEQRIVQMLMRQQVALRTDVEQTRAALDKATAELEAAGAALAAADDAQTRKRDTLAKAVVAGAERDMDQFERIQQRTRAAIAKAQKEAEAQLARATTDAQAMFAKALQEAWDTETREHQDMKSISQKTVQELRGEFQGLGEQLSGATGLSPAFARLKAAQTEVTSAISMAAAGGERAVRNSGDAVHMLEAWASEEEEVATSIAQAQDKAAAATREVQESATSGVDGLVAGVRAVELVEDGASSRWMACRDGATSVAARWAEAGLHAAKGISEVSTEQVAVRQQLSSLRADVSGHRVVAHQAAQEVASERIKHQAALQSLADLERAHGAEDGAADTSCCRSVQELADRLAAQAPVAALNARQAVSLAEAADVHGAALAAVAEVVAPALAAHEVAASQLGDEVGAAMESAADCLVQLRSMCVDWGTVVQRVAEEAEEPAAFARQLAADATDWHEKASAAFSKEFERWQEMVKNHGDRLELAVESADQAVVGAKEMATEGTAHAEAQQAEAEAARQRSNTAVADLVCSCSKALSQQHDHWRHGLSAPPLEAFVDEGQIFEDKPTPDKVPPFVESVLQGGLPPRPGEAALVAKFRGKEGGDGDARLSTAPPASGKTVGFEDAVRISTGAPRSALKEVQLAS